MFSCEKCTRFEYRSILDGQNPDEYSLPFCKKYDTQLFTDMEHFFIKGARLRPCKGCVSDEYKYFMKKTEEHKQMKCEDCKKFREYYNKVKYDFESLFDLVLEMKDFEEECKKNCDWSVGQ